MTAEAGPPANPGNKPGDKPGNNPGKAGKKPDTPPGKTQPRPTPPAKGGNAVVAKISGAGQRLHFSFGGELELRRNQRIGGHFLIVGSPQAPVGSLLTVTCRYRQFSDATLGDNQISFVGKGQCTRLSTTGELTLFDTVNEFRIVDNGQNDVIEVKMVGSTGISVPVGTLTFGDFNLEREN
jgi:hypothetical protein